MRQVGDVSQITPFGHWLRQYCRSSHRGSAGGGLAVTNLDYVLEDFQHKRLMLLEEKQNSGELHTAQRLTLEVLDRALWLACLEIGYQYCGFYVLRMTGTMPGPGMLLNDKPITAEQLVAHLNFQRRHTDPYFPPPPGASRTQRPADAVAARGSVNRLPDLE